MTNLSNCHQAPANPHNDNEGTSYYVCSDCGEACDLEKQTNQEDKVDNEECEFCGAPIVSVGYPDGSIEYECLDECDDQDDEL